MNIQNLREEITQIDQELVALFLKRMHVASRIADYKRKNDLPVYDPVREQIVLDLAMEHAGPDMSEYVKKLYITLMELSRDYQNQLI